MNRTWFKLHAAPRNRFAVRTIVFWCFFFCQRVQQISTFLTNVHGKFQCMNRCNRILSLLIPNTCEKRVILGMLSAIAEQWWEILTKMSFGCFVAGPCNLQIPYVQTQKVLQIGQVFRLLLLAAFNSGVGHPFHDSKNKAEQKKRNARSYCNFPRLVRNSMKNNENIRLILVLESLFSRSALLLSSFFRAKHFYNHFNPSGRYRADQIWICDHIFQNELSSIKSRDWIQTFQYCK